MRILSTRTPVTVSAFPYAVPSSGRAVLIGTNSADVINPPTHTASEWGFSLFEAYGGGCYVRDYSAGGAYVLAGTGGHRAPCNLGAAVFDFADATWKRIDNSNGMPWRMDDLSLSDTNGAPNVEIALSGVTPNAMPTPFHTYMNVLPIRAADGGGARGSVVTTMRGSTLESSVTSLRSHRFDLATGRWSRLSTNLISDAITLAGTWYEAPSVLDVSARRIYQLTYSVQSLSRLPYLDMTDWTWKAAPGWDWPPGSDSNESAFLDDLRRLLLMHCSTGNLKAIDLTDFASGVRNLNLAGSMPPRQNRWEHYPVDGCFYTYPGSGQQIYKLTPPAGNPLTGTWTVSTVAITGATLPAQLLRYGDGAKHYTRFFYVPTLQCFAWIAGGPSAVVLIKP